MKALVYHGPNSKAWEDVVKPTIIDDTDAIVRVDAVRICGTDLHILKGRYITSVLRPLSLPSSIGYQVFADSTLESYLDRSPSAEGTR